MCAVCRVAERRDPTAGHLDRFSPPAFSMSGQGGKEQGEEGRKHRLMEAYRHAGKLREPSRMRI
jgi:hypothetical protein